MVGGCLARVGGRVFLLFVLGEGVGCGGGGGEGWWVREARKEGCWMGEEGRTM